MSEVPRFPGPWNRGCFLVLLQNLGGPCPYFRDHRIGSVMVHQSISPHHSSACSDHDNRVSPMHPGKHPASGRQAIRTRAIGQVTVLEVVGPLNDVAEELDQAIQLALAEGPRGVVCDLSAAPWDAKPGPVEWLAIAGRHVRHWPGIPVAVACPNPRVREALRNHPLGRHLIVSASVPSAISAVLATPISAIEWLRLAPHPTAPRASRDFVARTLQGWGLDHLTPSAALVISELVTNSTMYAGSEIVLSVALGPGAVRLTVRDKSPDLPRPRKARLGPHGRGLIIVAGFSRDFGVMPTAEGGKVVWAVMDAPAAPLRSVHAVHAVHAVQSPPPPDSHSHSAPRATRPDSLLHLVQPPPNRPPLRMLPPVKPSLSPPVSGSVALKQRSRIECSHLFER
jgi:anti-sigma regulatory factor (Ser/Thr protein kinase)